jgi:uncharacterized membrane-anchored protein
MVEPLPDRPAPADEPRPGSAAGGLDDRIRQRERPLLLGIVLFQIAVLVGLAAARVPILLFGETILLRVQPVDPRDLMRGEYVILGYDLWPLEGLDTFARIGEEPRRRTVYVRLVPDPDGVHWRPDSVSEQRPAEGRFIRGIHEGYRDVRFGIEAYYVQEGEGPRLERALRDGRVSAEVALMPSGRAALRRLIVR